MRAGFLLMDQTSKDSYIMQYLLTLVKYQVIIMQCSDILYYSILFLNAVHLNSNDSLALQKTVIQVTYSQSWFDSSEFFLPPKQQQHPKQVQPTFSIPCLYHISQVAVRLREPRREDSLAGGVELAKGWAGQAGGAWMSKSHRLASHTPFSRSPQRAVGGIILY